MNGDKKKKKNSLWLNLQKDGKESHDLKRETKCL